ncbi:MAG: hypothetical protein WCP15_01795 [bacterium]
MKYLKSLLPKFFNDKSKKIDKSSGFSKFFREASSREKKKVFLDVAKKASEDQLELIKSVKLAR